MDICNAHNHPPGCQCGWGGVWYGGSVDSAEWLFNKGNRPRRLGHQLGTRNALSGGFVVPNSKCPICSSPVYFYQSPYGGRVFFDSLGPPWPKHPCTSITHSRKIEIARTTSWHKENWRPLTNVEILRVNDQANFYSLTGMSGTQRIQLQFISDEIVMAEVVRYRALTRGKFELSILDFDTVKNEWAVWDGFAQTSRELLTSQSEGLTRVTIHSHKLNLSQSGSSTALKPTDVPHSAKKAVLEKCPDCGASVKSKKLLNHLRRVHNYVPVLSNGKISGRLLVTIHKLDLSESGSSTVLKTTDVSPPTEKAVLEKCPDCGAPVKSKKLLNHLRQVHGYVPVLSNGKISGRLVVMKAAI